MYDIYSNERDCDIKRKIIMAFTASFILSFKRARKGVNFSRDKSQREVCSARTFDRGN